MSQRLVSRTWQKPFTPPDSIPERADVVVVGAGIVGVSAAWCLAQQGVRVVVCEKGHVAGEQSGRNWGWVRVMGRDTREIPMMLKSLSLWDSFSETLGEDVGFRRGGCLFTARTAEDGEGFEHWLQIADEFGIDSRYLSGDDLAKRVNGSGVRWHGAIFTPSDGRAEPHLATPAIARAAERLGATVLTSCAVRGIETSAGAVSAVITESGRIETSTVLCAAGAWTSVFCRALGVHVPQLRVKGTVARTAPGPDLFDGNIFDARLGIRRRLDGGYTVARGDFLEHTITPASFRYFRKFLPALMQDPHLVKLRLGPDSVDGWIAKRSWQPDGVSPFERVRVLDPAPKASVLRGLRRAVDEVFPALDGTPLVESWCGVIEASPDVAPIIDSVDSIPGFHIATGFSGHGFGLGPGAGYCVASMLTGAESGIDIRPLRLRRFFDGSPVRPQSSI